MRPPPRSASPWPISIPKITLSGSIGLQALQAKDLGNWGARQYGFGPTIQLPIFEGGRLRATLELRRAQQRAGGHRLSPHGAVGAGRCQHRARPPMPRNRSRRDAVAGGSVAAEPRLGRPGPAALPRRASRPIIEVLDARAQPVRLRTAAGGQHHLAYRPTLVDVVQGAGRRLAAAGVASSRGRCPRTPIGAMPQVPLPGV